MKKITVKTKISEVINMNPKGAQIMFEEGLMCVGCPMAMQESLEQGCKAHGMNKKKINEMIERLNKGK